MGASFSVSRWPHYLQYELLSSLSAALLKALTRFSLAMAEARSCPSGRPASTRRSRKVRILSDSFPQAHWMWCNSTFPISSILLFLAIIQTSPCSRSLRRCPSFLTESQAIQGLPMKWR